MSLPKPVDNGVLWFRPEVKENINWSGDPRKPLDLENSDAGLRLRPRTSFEIWKIEMAGISTKWSHGDRFAANDLRRSALENDLARQVRREQEAVQARDDLVAVVSHDLRNPMTVISMLCGMMQKAFSSEGAHTSRRISTAIDTMQQATARMNTLLEDLLDTSKIDAGRYSITRRRWRSGTSLKRPKRCCRRWPMTRTSAFPSWPILTCASTPTLSGCFRCCRTWWATPSNSPAHGHRGRTREIGGR